MKTKTEIQNRLYIYWNCPGCEERNLLKLDGEGSNAVMEENFLRDYCETCGTSCELHISLMIDVDAITGKIKKQ